MLKELTFRKTTSQLTKPIAGYHPKPGRQDTDRSSALQRLDGLIGVSSPGHLKVDEDHLKTEASAVFGKKPALAKYLASITKPKLARDQEEERQQDAHGKGFGEKKDGRKNQFEEVAGQKK